MDVSNFSTLIAQLGFPIACCIALFWYINKQSKQHKEEMDKMSEAINNNTAVMNEVLKQLQAKESAK